MRPAVVAGRQWGATTQECMKYDDLSSAFMRLYLIFIIILQKEWVIAHSIVTTSYSLVLPPPKPALRAERRYGRGVYGGPTVNPAVAE